MLLAKPQTVQPSGMRIVGSFLQSYHAEARHALGRAAVAGILTPSPPDAHKQQKPHLPFYFETGYALFAKRPSRPFPPPFLSLPSGSFSDPLSTHNRSRDRRPTINGEMIRGITNGDDAVLVTENFIAANDGVGAWTTKDRGHAALWSRLILHFWALEAERSHECFVEGQPDDPDPIKYLQSAYEQTVNATSSPNQWNGTTTACGVLLHHQSKSNSSVPILYVTNLGDCQCLVIRPKNGKNGDAIFKTSEQWHWFDCPRQLGTNSPDTPDKDAVLDKVEIEEDDVVLAMSDGVVDNLWEHEILENVIDSIDKWHASKTAGCTQSVSTEGSMLFVAQELVKAARNIAENPYAESPYMERAVEEGLGIEGGKLDDISVAAARCRRRKGG